MQNDYHAIALDSNGPIPPWRQTAEPTSHKQDARRARIQLWNLSLMSNNDSWSSEGDSSLNPAKTFRWNYAFMEANAKPISNVLRAKSEKKSAQKSGSASLSRQSLNINALKMNIGHWWPLEWKQVSCSKLSPALSRQISKIIDWRLLSKFNKMKINWIIVYTVLFLVVVLAFHFGQPAYFPTTWRCSLYAFILSIASLCILLLLLFICNKLNLSVSLCCMNANEATK